MSGKRADDAQTRKAIKQLKPPSATVVLDDDMLKTTNKLKVALGRSKRDANEIQQLLDAHTSKAAPVKHTQRRHPPLQFPLSLTSIINILNTNVYLPTDNPLDILVPPAHRYFETNNGSSNSGFGSGSANTTNGNMLVIQQVPLSSAASNSWAAIFIKLISDRGGLIGITPEVDWSYQDQWGADKDWADKIAGSILFTANVWFSAFEADTLAPVSNQRWQLYQNSNLVNSLAGSSHSDTLKDKLFEINATPGQPYLMGVTNELVESNTIPSNAPPPPEGTFTTHAALNATVPSIWVSGAN